MKRYFGVILLALSICALSLSAHDRELTFEDRVKAQEAIERVYYSHQLEATQPFEQAVPRSVLEAKVTKYLKQSAALEQVWKTTVTAEMLRHEWERIARNSRTPERLPEIYDALGHDPFLIQECFIRPALVERLARSFFQGDRVLQAAPRDRAERLADGLQRSSRSVDRDSPHAEIELRVVENAPSVREPFGREKQVDRGDEEALEGGGPLVREVGPADLEGWRQKLSNRVGEVSPEEMPDSFVLRILRETGAKSLRFAQYEIEKEPWESWWNVNQERFDPARVDAVASHEPATQGSPFPSASENFSPILDSVCIAADNWDNATLGGIPEPRVGNSTVWTGSLMVVWGGALFGAVGTGERYDPLTDSWTSVSQVGAPSNRADHRAVWTGTEMILWGGRNPAGASLNNGGRYNPASDTWSPMSSPTLGARYFHSAVWTGSEIIFFGGRDTTAGPPPLGSRYNPATDSWTPIATPGWTAKVSHTAVWTGTKMLVWGGNEGGAAVQSGGAYDPATNQWSTISTSGAPPAAQNHSAVWTGSRMIVWGGEVNNNSTTLSAGGIYNPQTDSWTLTSTAGAPAARALHSAIWTGSEMLVWGGRSFSGSQEVRHNTGGRFNPVLNSWTATSTTGAPAAVAAPTAVWTGDRMVVWGNRSGGRYDPATDSWTPVSLGNLPRPLSEPTAVWTGNRMIVWGGDTETGTTTNAGYRYDPLLDAWSPTSSGSAPSSRRDHMALWTGIHLIVWGGRNGNTVFGDGARYDPVADTWSPTSSSGAPPPRYDATAVWSGAEMFLWGGSQGFSLTGGGRYDPIADSWVTIPTLGSPSPRSRHAAVWTGNEMIVWGGWESGGGATFGNGGRFNPTTNQWTLIQFGLPNHPEGRQLAAAHWTGTRMLLWGGWGSFGQPLSSGASYDPQTNSWTPITNFLAPAGRVYFSSVWTGSEMIVWGGGTHINTPAIGPMNSGGRYDPAANSWAPTSLTQAPTPRGGHVAVWTGTRMIVWGRNVDAGRYVPYQLDSSDSDGDGMSPCAGDCNDANPTVHPGAPEVCDGVDNDCDAIVDEGFADVDADGYPVCGGDCNDANPAVHPGAAEACNGIDDDCDALVDEGFPDADGDGYLVCFDCNDANPAVHPGAEELCNGIDDNCNAQVDDRDLDADGYSVCTNDCNDANPAIHPNAFEACNGLDDDCDGQIDEDIVGPDSDQDGYPPCLDCNDSNPAIHPGVLEQCNGVDDDCNRVIDDRDIDGDGSFGCGVDCDDANPSRYPGATEVCNLQDDDCDFLVDEGFDQDGDGISTCNGDCNDADPGAWDLPFEVFGFGPDGTSTTDWVWDAQAPFIGPGIVYDVAAGVFGPGGIIVTAGECQGTTASTQFTDPQPAPTPGHGRWFLVRSKNSCGLGIYGTDSLGGDRPGPQCP